MFYKKNTPGGADNLTQGGKIPYCNLSTVRQGDKLYAKNVKNYVALDIETTGLSAQDNEIINIGAIRYRNDKPVEELNIFVKPKERIPSFITNITGISNEMVANAPDIDEVLPALLDFVGDDTLLGHNIRFDLGFLNYALANHGYKENLTTYIDTMMMARSFRKNNKLEQLVRDYVNPNYEEAHQGLDDARNTALVFQKFKKMMK